MRLIEKHFNVIKMLAYTGIPKRDIARINGITEQTLYNWLKDQDFIEALGAYESKLTAALKAYKKNENLDELLQALMLKDSDYIVISELIEGKIGRVYKGDKSYEQKLDIFVDRAFNIIEKKLDNNTISSRLLAYYIDNYIKYIGLH